MASAAATQKLRISPPGATFVGRQMVTLSSGNAGEIRYTVDGSVPGMNSPRYQEPLALDGPAVVRARLVKDGKLEPEVASANFMRVADELRSWSSNLPVVVLHTHGNGVLPPVEDAPRIAGSVTVLTPNTNGRTSLVGPPRSARAPACARAGPARCTSRRRATRSSFASRAATTTPPWPCWA